MFTNFINEINNTQVDNAEDFAVAKLMYNLIKYSEKCSKAPEGLYQFCRVEPKDTTADFESFKFNILNSINHTRKSDKIHKDFELYQAFMHNFLSQNISIFPIYILLTRRINTFRSKGTDKVWREYRDILGPRNHTQNSKVFIHNFLSQNVPIPPNHILKNRAKSNFNTCHQISYQFLSVKSGSILFFSHLSTCVNPAIFLDTMLQALILCLYFFEMLCVA